MDGEFRFDAFRMRLRDVEHDARGAAAGVERHLEVVKVIVERSGIEGDAVLRIFDSRLIVPRRFVAIGLEVAEGREVSSGAKGNVQRIVDATEPESLCRLNVDAKAAVRLPAENTPRTESVRLRRVGPVVEV